MKRIVSLLFACLLVAVTAAAQDANQNWVKCRVLQFKLNRLYFDAGEESLVFAGQRAVVMKKKDTLWSGVIEQAYDGVSISERIEKPIELKSISAFVQTAPVDSHAVIRVGTTMSPAVLKMVHADGLDSFAMLTHGLVDSFTVIRYDDAPSMTVDFEAGMLDGILTYRGDGFGNDSRVESAWAPYIAALVPYGQSVHQGLPLTQPLITQFDRVIARSQFEGTEIRFESTLVSPIYSSGWPAYNPAGGRWMLRPTVERAMPVKIYAPDRELRKIAGYFADLLARERIKSDLVETLVGCDFSLKFIPAGRNRDATLRALLELLGPSGGGESDVAAAIEDLRQALRYIEGRSDSLQTLWDWPDAEILLTNALSCYPLFRPRIYFASHQSIRGSIFNPTGEVDPVGLMRVQSVGEGGRR